MVEGKPKQQAPVGDQPVALATASPELVRRGAEQVTARSIQLPHASEARREGDLGDREVGIIQQPPGEVGSARPGDLIGRHPQVLLEQTAQVPPRDEQPRPQVVLALAVESAIQDEPHGPADQFGADPDDRGLHAIGAATQAGSKPGRLRRGRQQVAPDVLGRRGSRPAPGPTVDPGGKDGGDVGHPTIIVASGTGCRTHPDMRRAVG
jgi:hypothetical protein